MEQVVEKEVRVDEQQKDFRIDVNINEEFLENSDDKVFITMMPLKNGEGTDTQLRFASNHRQVDKDLNIVIDHFRHWIKKELGNNVIISKLQELDRMQYSQNIPCNELGVSVARLYHQYLSSK